jgi:hypothetical protein
LKQWALLVKVNKVEKPSNRKNFLLLLLFSIVY